MEPKADLILLTPEEIPEESILVLILISPSYAIGLTSRKKGTKKHLPVKQMLISFILV